MFTSGVLEHEQPGDQACSGRRVGGLGVVRGGASSVAQAHGGSWTRRATRGCRNARAGNPGREEGPSLPVQPWPVGAPWHQVHSVTQVTTRAAAVVGVSAVEGVPGRGLAQVATVHQPADRRPRRGWAAGQSARPGGPPDAAPRHRVRSGWCCVGGGVVSTFPGSPFSTTWWVDTRPLVRDTCSPSRNNGEARATASPSEGRISSVPGAGPARGRRRTPRPLPGRAAPAWRRRAPRGSSPSPPRGTARWRSRCCCGPPR